MDSDVMSMVKTLVEGAFDTVEIAEIIVKRKHIQMQCKLMMIDGHRDCGVYKRAWMGDDDSK